MVLPIPIPLTQHGGKFGSEWTQSAQLEQWAKNIETLDSG